MAEVYNNDNPLTMKKLAVRLDAIEGAIEGFGRNSSTTDSDASVVGELKRIADAEVEANRRRRTMAATHVTRIVLEIIVAIVLCTFAIGCTSEFPNLILGGLEEGGGNGSIGVPDLELPPIPGDPDDPTVTPDDTGKPDGGNENDNPAEPDKVVPTLRGTAWKCAPIMVEHMEVIRLEFNEAEDEGTVIFLARGREKFRKFSVVAEGLEFKSPDSLWTYETDHKTNLTVTSGDGIEIAFVPVVSDENR